MGPKLSLEAPQRSPASERQSGHAAENGQDLDDPRSHLTSSCDLVLPAFDQAVRCHARSSSRPPCPSDTKTDLTRKSVGCTTHSTSTLSAQFRWASARSERFLYAPYLRTSAGRTIGGPVCTGQYATLPMGAEVAKLAPQLQSSSAGPRSEFASGGMRNAHIARRQLSVLPTPCRAR